MNKEQKAQQEVLTKLKSNMILFGKVIMPNMFVSASPDFHYTIADVLMNRDEKQINIIAPRVK